MVENSDAPTVEISKVERILKSWVPKTELGRRVYNGEINSIEEIFSKGYSIREPEIVDILLPELKEEIILIGGSSGKGGGIKRIPIKSTVRMHKSGRKRSLHAMVVVGNGDGYIGVGYSRGSDARDAIMKAAKKARLDIRPVIRGCGSWECHCHGNHTIPYKTEGKSGSVRVKLMPGPRGLGLVASPEMKKILSLAGIKDVWMKSYGHTRTRINHVYALLNALDNLYNMRISEDMKKDLGYTIGMSKA